MKITAIEAYLLSAPSPQAKSDAMLVRVVTNEGLVGYAPGRACENVKRMIDHVIAPFLIGRPLDDLDALRIAFQQGPGADAEVGNIYGAVEIALYDLAAKARDLPVSEIIGGRVRERIRLYASAGRYLSPKECAAEAVRVRGLGLNACKLVLRGQQAEDLAAVRAAREAVGADFYLMVDAHNSYPAEAVEQLARSLADYQIVWLEEALPAGDRDGSRRLKQLGLVPLASGRHEPNELRYLDLIESAAVDYVQMDVIHQGGYATARRLFPDIARAGLRFAFHSSGTLLDVIAAGHLGACWPESVVRWLEYPSQAIEILKQPLAIRRGELIVPQGPGLGVDVDESVIWRYPWMT